VHWFISVFLLSAVLAFSHATTSYAVDFQPCEPESEFADVPDKDEDFLFGVKPPQIDFCATWNPEWGHHGNRCCAKFVVTRKRSANRCAAQRRKASYCDEMTSDQKLYSELAASGKLGDVLEQIRLDVGRYPAQSYCNVNNGFLAWGRRLIPTLQNRIALRRPERCVDFGTDPLLGMLEWTGREISKSYSGPEHAGLRFVVGDLSAPRGGCLSSRHGRRGHVSHTAGIDVDVGFLTPKIKRASPDRFHRDFDPQANWWLLKKIFYNPYACVKVVFLDRRHIAKLSKYAAREDMEEWMKLARFIRHIKYHRDHLHIRVGDRAGKPGCAADPHPELETEEDMDLVEEIPGDSEASTAPLNSDDEITIDATRVPVRTPAKVPLKKLNSATR
jgi:murein endopeptidase